MPEIRGLYAITPDEPDTPRLSTMVAQAIEGGAPIIQYRNKQADHALRYEQAHLLSALCRERNVTFIVNDELELAFAVNADGVHLGRDDVAVASARSRLGSTKLIGVSCYNRLELARDAVTAGVDYVAFGSVFPSRVKPDAVHAPLDLLLQARRELNVPIVAIGGITLANAPSLIEAGADAVAVISALFDSPDIVRAARGFAELFPQQNTSSRGFRNSYR